MRIIKDRWIAPYDEIWIRFNNEAGGDSAKVWRVFVNGRQHFAGSFRITGTVSDHVTEENGIQKYNLACRGRARWKGNSVMIFASRNSSNEIL